MNKKSDVIMRKGIPSAKWIALSSLAISYGLVSCSPKVNTEAPISPEAEGQNQDQATPPAEDDAVTKQWVLFEATLQNEIGDILLGVGTPNEISYPSEETVAESDVIRATLARDFVVKARKLGLERGEFYKSKWINASHESIQWDSQLGNSISGTLDQELINFGAVKFHFDAVMHDMTREANGFFKNLYDDLADVSGGKDAVEQIAEKGTRAFDVHFRAIPEGESMRALEEHGVKGGAAGLGALASMKLSSHLNTTGYRNLVAKNDPANIMRMLLEADPVVNESRVKWGKAKLISDALPNIASLEAKVAAEARKLAIADRLQANPANVKLYGRYTVSLRLAKDALSNARRAQETTARLFAEFQAAEALARANLRYEIQNGKFRAVAEGTGFKTREDLIKALKKTHYSQGNFGFVRSGARWVLNVAGVAMAAVTVAELVPLALDQEIVWVPKDVQAALSGTQSNDQ